ncbi:MAG: putative Fe-S cluster assembly protein SufT [Legionellales bacterium]|nr:putative Fe-S cluster assembly protein SufT [Legionellales bacterium]
MPKLRPGQPIQLLRDCKAIRIPSAEKIVLPVGTIVNVQQVLGGNFTVVVDGNLVRINGDDADSLGIKLPPCRKIKKADVGVTPDGFISSDDVWNELRKCYDPEIPVNIVELGLIYDCRIENNLEGFGSFVYIEMTLTAPACAMGPVIIDDIKMRLQSLKNVLKVEIELVFDPPWSSDKVSEAGKLSLGLL